MTFFSIAMNILNFIFILNIFFAVIVIICERKNTQSTWTWLMIMLFIPFAGFILYLFFGQDLRKKKFFTLKKSEEISMVRAVEKQKELLNYINYNNESELISKYADIINLNLNSGDFLISTNNKVDILNNGREKFQSLIDALKSAKKFIHMEYYIFQNDKIGNTVLNLLIQKAYEGIEVKLLYDGMGCLHNKSNFFKPLIDAGGSVSCFFPPFVPYVNIRINYRNHRKICVIDGMYGFVGGLNIGDEYLGLSKKFGFWRDIHLHIEGDAVDSLETRFLLDWRFSSGEDINVAGGYFPPKKNTRGIPVQIISSGPDSKWCSIRNTYLKLINKAEKSIYIETPYFIPDNSIITALKLASLSGIDVKIIIPNKPDHPFIYWASASYIWELVECGASCYAYKNGFIHSKMLSIDHDICTIGTANMDIRSFSLNFEVNAVIYDKITTQKLDSYFKDDLSKSYLMTISDYNDRPLTAKLKESIARLLSPIL